MTFPPKNLSLRQPEDLSVAWADVALEDVQDGFLKKLNEVTEA